MEAGSPVKSAAKLHAALAAGAPDAAAQILQVTRRGSSNAGGVTAAELVAAGCVPLLVAQLGPGSAELTRETAAAALGALAVTDRAALVAAGALPPLLEQVGPAGGSLGVRAAAAGTLGLIALGRELQPQITPAIPALIELLSAGPAGAPHASEAQTAAAGALWNLAADPNNKLIIAAAGGVPPLVALLTSNPEAAVYAVGALAVLAVHGAIRADICGRGAVAAMVRLLVSRSTAGYVKARVAGALRNLSCGALPAAREAAEAGAIPALVELLRSDLPEAQSNAAAALGNLAYNSPANIEAIRAAGGVEQLQALLDDEAIEAPVKCKVAGSLQNLGAVEGPTFGYASVGSTPRAGSWAHQGMAARARG